MLEGPGRYERAGLCRDVHGRSKPLCTGAGRQKVNRDIGASRIQMAGPSPLIDRERPFSTHHILTRYQRRSGVARCSRETTERAHPGSKNE